MKVLYLVDSYPNEKIAAPNIFVHNQVLGVKNEGYDVAVLKLDLRSIKNKRKWGFEQYEYEGIRVFVMSFPVGPIPHLLMKIYRFSTLQGIKRIMKLWGKPDIIHAHFGNMANCAYYVKNKYGIPYVVTEHSSSIIKGNLSDNDKKLLKVGYDGAQYIWAVGNQLKERIAEFYNGQIDVLPNIVPDRFRIITNIKKYPIFTFISVGALIPRKRMTLLIEAIEHINKEQLRVKLVIIGEGSEKKLLHELIQRKKLDGIVELVGEINNNELPQYYNRAHCFVLASAYETFGIVWREAMACGLPVIGTICGGPEEDIDDSNGILIPVDDLEALIQAMKWMYHHSKDYASTEISGIVRQECSTERIVTQLIKKYKVIVEGSMGKNEK